MNIALKVCKRIVQIDHFEDENLKIFLASRREQRHQPTRYACGGGGARRTGNVRLTWKLHCALIFKECDL